MPGHPPGARRGSGYQKHTGPDIVAGWVERQEQRLLQQPVLHSTVEALDMPCCIGRPCAVQFHSKLVLPDLLNTSFEVNSVPLLSPEALGSSSANRLFKLQK